MAPNAPLPLGAASATVGARVLRLALVVTRAETRAYCDALGLAYADDESNGDAAFLRNRVRAACAGVHARPHVRAEILTLAGDARARIAVLDREAACAIAAATDDGAVWLSRPVLREMPAATAAHAFRIAIVRLLGDARDFGRQHYATMAAATGARTGAVFEMPRGVVVTVDPAAIAVSRGRLAAQAIDAASSTRCRMRVISEAGGCAWSRRAGSSGRARRSSRRRGPCCGRAVRGIAWRSPAAGTRSCSLYTDRKVPRRERDAAPVIACGSAVIWTPFGGGLASADAGTPLVVEARRRTAAPATG